MKAHKSRDLRISDDCFTWSNFRVIVFLLKQDGKRYVWVALRLNFLGMTSASAVDWRFRNHYFNHYFNHCRVCERYRYLSLISVSIFRAEICLLTFPVYKRHQSLISVSIWSDRKVERLFTKNTVQLFQRFKQNYNHFAAKRTDWHLHWCSNGGSQIGKAKPLEELLATLKRAA